MVRARPRSRWATRSNWWRRNDGTPGSITTREATSVGELRVPEELRAFRQVGHAQRRLREGGAGVVARVHLAEHALHGRVAPQRDPERAGHRCERHVVVGRGRLHRR